MVENTKIEWCDHTFSPWEGCQKAGPGCDHCYAETRNNRFGGGNWGPGALRRMMADAYWKVPLRWDAQAREKGIMPTAFPSLCDPFDNAAPEGGRARFAALIAATPNIRWLLLTKRIGNAREMLAEMFGSVIPDNVCVGATVVNQQEYDRDVPKLRDIDVETRFLSIEPMLGPIDLHSNGLLYQPCPSAGCMVMDRSTGQYECCSTCDWTGIGDELAFHWVIAGGESGPGARPSDPVWYRALRDQCAGARVPFLFKQWGEWHADALRYIDCATGACPPPRMRIGKKKSGRLLDGVEHNGFPW